MQRKGVVIAGLAGGSGKSIVSVGLVAALTASGRSVVPFKKGPDYIDAGWLQLAAGKKCYNLDPYLMGRQDILDSFASRSLEGEFAVVEGNRGLYDGVNAEGGYSTAELALALDLPVILVVNCTKTTRTVAAMVLGCREFDRRVDIRGVVLNQIATGRQRSLITEAVEKYTGIPVLGAVPRLKKDIFPMRHLGMIPHQEYGDSPEAITFLAELIEKNVDLERLQQVMAVLPEGCDVQKEHAISSEVKSTVRIGVLQDAAFQFYYSENLEALERHGAELIFINAMRDHELPPLDGLYIGGGFPETSARELAENESFKASIKKAADDGLPIYAECGGLIYLGRSILLEDGREYPLTGVFPIRFGMAQKPQAHGYTIFVVEGQNSFYRIGEDIKGHEFRYSKVLEWGGRTQDLVLKMVRGKGFIDGRDGHVYKNVLALYTHVHAEGTPGWAPSFIAACRGAAREKVL